MAKLLGAAAILLLAGACASRDPYAAGGYVVWDEGGYGYGYACAVDDWYGSGDSAFPGRARVVPVERPRAPRAITRDASAGAAIATASGDGPSPPASVSGPSPITAPPPPMPAPAPVSHSAPPPPRAEPHA